MSDSGDLSANAYDEHLEMRTCHKTRVMRHDFKMSRERRTRALVLLALSGSMLLSACTLSASSEPPDKSAPPTGTPSPWVLQAAPRECPTAPQRAAQVPVDQAVSAMGGHLPTEFPATDFGLEQVWSMSARQSYATWTDETCRTVTVYYNPDQGGGPTTWKTGYDKPKACGNAVMGMGECIGFHVALPSKGGLSVQTIGLSQAEADRLVQSIPL